jgi:hypothetical protein
VGALRHLGAERLFRSLDWTTSIASLWIVYSDHGIYNRSFFAHFLLSFLLPWAQQISGLIAA